MPDGLGTEVDVGLMHAEFRVPAAAGSVPPPRATA